MGLVSSKGKKQKTEVNTNDKVLEIDASMQGDFHFKDPVNLKINGKFEGTLDTKGKLIVNEGSIVNAEIKGEDIDIAGHVNGNIFASKSITFRKTANVAGNIKTPLISIEKGASYNGKCDMINKTKQTEEEKQPELMSSNLMNIKELSTYIEVDEDSILQWIKEKRIPVKKIKEDWKFDRKEIDEWITTNS